MESPITDSTTTTASATPVCIVDGCKRKAIYNNFTYCVAHKSLGTAKNEHVYENFIEKDTFQFPVPVFCQICKSTKPLNCHGFHQRDNTSHVHRCPTCDSCICGNETVGPLGFCVETDETSRNCMCCTWCKSCIDTIHRTENYKPDGVNQAESDTK